VTTRKVGVEEEMFLVDPTTRELLPSSAQAVAEDTATSSDHEVEQELFLQQVETQSQPHRHCSAHGAGGGGRRR
jgi:carboxylate-amine ligase